MQFAKAEGAMSLEKVAPAEGVATEGVSWTSLD